jgi:tetratricopeptide (TPR) repeat protein
LSVLLKATGRPDGQDAGAFINLGWIYHAFKPPRVNEAVAAYNQALKLDPRNARAAMGVALSYRAGKQWARAISAYERVSTMDARLNGDALLGTAWCHYRSGDDYKARFFAGLAKKAGADVGALRTALSRPVQAGTAAAPKAEDEPSELVQQLGATNAGEQAFAVRRLVGLGRPAVPYLATALGQPRTALAVREAIVEGLAGMGTGAREALPQLDRLIKAGPLARGTEGSPEERAREVRLISAMQAAATKLRGK